MSITSVGPNLAQAEASNKDDTKTVIALLNSRRTQATLLFYAPVISEMINNSHSETQSTTRKIFRFFTRTTLQEDQFRVEQVRVCGAHLINTWQKQVLLGIYSSTEKIIDQLLKNPVKNCGEVWNGFINYKEVQFAHWAYLAGLIKAELNFSVNLQKSQQLQALSHLIQRGGGDQYPKAAEEVALYFLEDKDEDIVAKAKDLVRNIPDYVSFRKKLDWVRPDLTQSGGFVRPALTALGSILSSVSLGSLTAAQINAATFSVGLHGAGLSVALTDPKSSDRFKIDGLARLIYDYQQSKNSGGWIPVIKFDSLESSLIKKFAEESVRGSESLNQKATQLGSFVISKEAHQLKKVELLMAEQLMVQLSEVSKDVGAALKEESKDFEININQARQIVFNRTKIKRYKKNQTELIPLLMGQGGNCQANTLLMLSVFFPYRNSLPAHWVLAAERMPHHIQPVLWNKKTNLRIDLVSGQKAVVHRNALFAPEFYFKGALKLDETDWSGYLLNSPSDVTFFNKSSMMKKTLNGNPVFNLPQATYEAPEPYIPDEAEIEFTAITKTVVDENQNISGQQPVIHPNELKCSPAAFNVLTRISTEHLGTDVSSGNIFQTLSVRFSECKDSQKEVFQYSIVVLNEEEQKILLKQTNTAAQLKKLKIETEQQNSDNKKKKLMSEEQKKVEIAKANSINSNPQSVPPAYSDLEKLVEKQINVAIAVQNAIRSTLTSPEKKTDLFQYINQLKPSKSPHIGYNEILELALYPAAVAQSVTHLHRIKFETSDVLLADPFNFFNLLYLSMDVLKKQGFEDYNRILFSHQSARRYFANLSKLVKIIDTNLETIVQIIDSPQVPHENKLILLQTMKIIIGNFSLSEELAGAAPETLLKKYPLLQLSLDCYNLSRKYMELIADPRRVGILESGEKQKVTSPKVPLFDEGTTAAFEVLDLEEQARNKKNKSQCTSSKASDCESKTMWINIVPTKIYISVETFFKLYFQVINATHDAALEGSNNLPINYDQKPMTALTRQLADRWTQKLEKLLLQNVDRLFPTPFPYTIDQWIDARPEVEMFNSAVMKTIGSYWLRDHQTEIKKNPQYGDHPDPTKVSMSSYSYLHLPKQLQEIYNCGFELPSRLADKNGNYVEPAEKFQEFANDYNDRFQKLRTCLKKIKTKK